MVVYNKTIFIIFMQQLGLHIVMWKTMNENEKNNAITMSSTKKIYI